MAKVFSTWNIHPDGVALLKARGEVDYEFVQNASAAELEARIADVEAVIVGLTPVTAGAIAKAAKLKAVCRFGVGYDAVDVEALTRHGIPLAVVGDANAVTVAEHALGLMVAVSKRIVVCDRAVREGNYHLRSAMPQSELWGKTVLIVGFGRIGSRVAKRCAAFDMDVLVADPYVAGAAVEGHGYRYAGDFRAVLAEADIVTLHLPANQDGSPVMTAAEFADMKPNSFFINVARGSLVDEDALVEALTGGRLRGAALDVTRKEPPAPDNPLLRLDNVILTPHNAALTEECFRRMSLVSAQNALDAIDGRLKPEHVVNKEVLVPKVVDNDPFDRVHLPAR